MNKKSYAIGGIIMIVVIIIYFASGNKLDNNNVVKGLTSEKKITHGHGLAVDIANSQNLYIATHHGLLVLKNEKDLYRLGASYDDYMGFTPHPQNSEVFYSSGHPQRGGNLGFQKSEDGGYTWQEISGGVDGPVDFHAMAISPVNPNLLYGWYRGALQRSLDAGKTWEIINNNLLIVQLTADPQNEDTAYAATPDGKGILISRDSGVTWNSLSKDLEGGQVSLVALHPSRAQELFTFAEKLGGLGKSIDGGKTWNKIRDDFNGETVLYVTFDKQNQNTMYLLTHQNAIYKSSNNGETWSKIY